MIMYFAGADANPKYTDILVRNGVKSKLESYYSLGNKTPSKLENYLLDSGGFVARTKGIKISVSEYADYINKHDIKFAFNLDTNDIKETLDNQKYLETHTKAYILPIYHYSDYVTKEYKGLLKEFAKDYDYIALGGVAGVAGKKNSLLNYLDYCFSITRDKIKVHGLGMTANALLERYPYYSVDSTSWLGFARYGNSKSNSKVMAQMKARSRHYLQNTEEEVIHTLQIEDYITKLWESRGIKW